jgi:hypothetical protein
MLLVYVKSGVRTRKHNYVAVRKDGSIMTVMIATYV